MILFIDDEEREMSSYVQELELSGLDVRFESNVDKALEAFNENIDNIQLIILDVMMVAGTAFQQANTEGGLRTGIYFHKIIREKLPKVPIIIFTNVSDSRVASDIRQDKKSWFLLKEDILPFELVDKITKFLEE